jgi:hypothetical protein
MTTKKPKKLAEAEVGVIPFVAPERKPETIIPDPPAAEVCTVCGTLRLGLSPDQPCAVDGYVPGAR